MEIQCNISNKFFHAFTLPDGSLMPESISDKVEELELKMALKPETQPYITLTFDEYNQIYKHFDSETIRIRVNDYYGNPSYYSVMPQAIFDALEIAALNDEQFVDVNKLMYDKMISDYKIKMSK